MTTVIEGEVVETSDLDLLPPSKDEKLAALARMTPEQQVETVTGMLVQSNVGLLVAIAAQDLPGIAEAKQKAATIQEITKQLRMGKEMALHAAEFVRRAERGLGVAIREGQARGVIATPDEVASAAGKVARGSFSSRQNALGKPADTDFAERSELSGNSTKGQFGIYGMTDGVSDAQFEESIAEAKADGNLSRANVARKCKAKVQGTAVAAAQPEAPTPAAMPARNKPEPVAEQPKKRLTKHDSTEMLANINGMLNGIVQSIPFIDPADIDAAENKHVIENIKHSMAQVRRLLKGIENG